MLLAKEASKATKDTAEHLSHTLTPGSQHRYPTLRGSSICPLRPDSRLIWTDLQSALRWVYDRQLELEAPQKIQMERSDRMFPPWPRVKHFLPEILYTYTEPIANTQQKLLGSALSTPGQNASSFTMCVYI